MLLGKTLRQRRIFSRGRALIGMLDGLQVSSCEGMRAAARAFARADMDALIITPGTLDLIAEDLGSLALILRLNLNWEHATPVGTVESASGSGAEAVALYVDTQRPQHLDLFGGVAADARRAGMPVLAEMAGGDLASMAAMATEFGADMILIRADQEGPQAIRQSVKFAARPILAIPGPTEVPAIARASQNLLDCGVQGIVVGAQPEPVLGVLRSLVHDGIHLEEKLHLLK